MSDDSGEFACEVWEGGVWQTRRGMDGWPRVEGEGGRGRGIYTPGTSVERTRWVVVYYIYTTWVSSFVCSLSISFFLSSFFYAASPSRERETHIYTHPAIPTSPAASPRFYPSLRRTTARPPSPAYVCDGSTSRGRRLWSAGLGSGDGGGVARCAQLAEHKAIGAGMLLFSQVCVWRHGRHGFCCLAARCSPRPRTLRSLVD